jgi:hypothetical protein
MVAALQIGNQKKVDITEIYPEIGFLPSKAMIRFVI